MLLASLLYRRSPETHLAPPPSPSPDETHWIKRAATPLQTRNWGNKSALFIGIHYRVPQKGASHRLHGPAPWPEAARKMGSRKLGDFLRFSVQSMLVFKAISSISRTPQWPSIACSQIRLSYVSFDSDQF